MDLTATEVLALTIYGESRGEPIQGQIAVACVIRNRVARRNKTYEEICLAPKQFSCWNEDDPNLPVLKEFGDKMKLGEPIDNIFINKAIWVAKGIIQDHILDNTRGADHYLTNALYSSGNVQWAKKLTMTRLIGNHTFLT